MEPDSHINLSKSSQHELHVYTIEDASLLTFPRPVQAHIDREYPHFECDYGVLRRWHNAASLLPYPPFIDFDSRAAIRTKKDDIRMTLRRILDLSQTMMRR